ncbi:testis-specific serine/threonine-protein kinase 3-like [Anthonomus grandis grandis]|uniref:testis-specific serine/threonine-protein kinase 3-like n=1 Tax=Anthonomus grandis grandis TaxID=2921223 RepID=UPI002164F7FC|nr:testis-specific serine/threonine-protein kinase 3-like [Anthonomus grandis grandis]
MNAKGKLAAGEPNVKALSTIGYRLGKTIGRGTYSKVCIALNEKGEKFACKIIKKKYAGSDFINKFLPREIKIISTIKHPNIVQVYKILESDDVVYILMDYCKHGDLLEYIKAYGFFPEEKSKFYFRQIVDAVHYLHDRDIAHRDLKCENVFMMWNNQLKLGDFGFARSCTDRFGRKVLSDTFCGSAAYAAPEILKGIAYDPKMYDMWALGCILYIMITASMPFDDTNIKKLIRAQLNRSIFAITLLWPEHSSMLKKLINSLLEPDLDKRLTIKQLRKHPWFEDGSVTKMKKLLSLSDSSLF